MPNALRSATPHPREYHVKKFTFALALIAITSLSTSAFAQTNEDWLDKNMGFGIGASSGVVQNGTTGLSIRFFPVEVFGLELVLGGGTDRQTVTVPASQDQPFESKSFERTSHFDVSFFGDFRFLRSNRSALSGYLGLGISNIGAAQSFPVAGAQGQTVTGSDSVTDFAVELGLRGEVFLYKFFSVHGRVGINLNPYSNNEAPTVTDPQNPVAPNLLEPENGGMDVRIFDTSNLLGQFGFTCWFN